MSPANSVRADGLNARMLRYREVFVDRSHHLVAHQHQMPQVQQLVVSELASLVQVVADVEQVLLSAERDAALLGLHALPDVAADLREVVRVLRGLGDGERCVEQDVVVKHQLLQRPRLLLVDHLLAPHDREELKQLRDVKNRKKTAAVRSEAEFQQDCDARAGCRTLEKFCGLMLASPASSSAAFDSPYSSGRSCENSGISSCGAEAFGNAASGSYWACSCSYLGGASYGASYAGASGALASGYGVLVRRV